MPEVGSFVEESLDGSSSAWMVNMAVYAWSLTSRAHKRARKALVLSHALRPLTSVRISKYLPVIMSSDRKACASGVVPSIESTSSIQRFRPARTSNGDQAEEDETSSYGIKRTVQHLPRHKAESRQL